MRDRHAAVEVRAVALEELVRLDGQEDVEVARRPAAQPRLALAGEPDARAVLDAGRHVDRQRALARDAARSRRRPRRGCRSPRRGRRRSGRFARSRRSPAARARGPGRRRSRRSCGFEPGLAPVPEQASQAIEVGILTRRGLALEGLLERDLHVVAQVGAALAPAASGRRGCGPSCRRKGRRRCPPWRRRTRRRCRRAAPPCSKAAWPKRS